MRELSKNVINNLKTYIRAKMKIQEHLRQKLRIEGCPTLRIATVNQSQADNPE